MDPLHPLVCNIFNNFAGFPCCSQRFHNLYNNPCCSTNPWHPLWPSTLSTLTFRKIQRDVADSIVCLRGPTIAHLKGFFVISNGYFTDFHLASWFERYDRLNLSICLTQGGCTYQYLPHIFFSLLRQLHKEFHTWLEIYLQDLKWVFYEISFEFLV